MLALIDVLRQEFQGSYRDELQLFMGPGDDAQLADWVEQLVAHALGEPVIGATFASKSAGTTFGLTLRSGAGVVLKLYWPRYTHAELVFMECCLDHVLKHGFPAPRLLKHVFRTDRGLLAAIYEHVSGTLVDPHQVAVRHEMVQRLAELHEILSDIEPAGLPPSPVAAEALYSPSHRAFLKIDNSCPEAAWIDARARTAKHVVQAARLPLVPAHLDWNMANTLWQNGHMTAIDWDSLGAACEPDMVGRAAAVFTAQWGLPVRLTPTHEEARAFVTTTKPRAAAASTSKNDACSPRPPTTP